MSHSSLRIVHLTSVPITLRFLEDQVRALLDLQVEVTAISTPGPDLTDFQTRTGAATYGVPITRTISPFADLKALWRLFRAFRRIRPRIVVAGTPKAGLLGVLAARMARVPSIVFQVHGLPHTSKVGFSSLALRVSTRIACMFSHKVICVSRSTAKLLTDCGFCRTSKIVVPANGSVGGVDAENSFNPMKISRVRVSEFRQRLGIPDHASTIGFAGRLVVDKGCRELVAAWQALRHDPNLHLLIAGDPEPHDPLPPGILERLQSDSRVHLMGTVTDMALFFAAIDLAVLPTYREGFPVVVLESSAMAIPVVATTVTGCVDAVIDGVTGTLVASHSSDELVSAIRRYLEHQALRIEHGQAARARVLRDFRPADVIQATLEVYRRLDATEHSRMLERAHRVNLQTHS